METGSERDGGIEQWIPEPGMAVFYNPSTQEEEAGMLIILGQARIHTEFQTSLSHSKALSQTNKSKHRAHREKYSSHQCSFKEP